MAKRLLTFRRSSGYDFRFLDRAPQVGDRVTYGNVHYVVVSADPDGDDHVYITLREVDELESGAGEPAPSPTGL